MLLDTNCSSARPWETQQENQKILASSLDIALGLSCELKFLELRGLARREELATSKTIVEDHIACPNESQTTSTSFNSSFLLWVSPSQTLTLESDSISFFTLQSNPYKALVKVSKGFISKPFDSPTSILRGGQRWLSPEKLHSDHWLPVQGMHQKEWWSTQGCIILGRNRVIQLACLCILVLSPNSFTWSIKTKQ